MTLPAASLPAAGASSGVSGVAVGGVAVSGVAVGGAAKTATPPATAAASTAAAGHDDLKRIRGIGPEIDAALHRVGIRRYSEIAGWSASDVDKVSKTLGLKGRIEHENWIEQAQVLSKGGETAFSRRYDRGEIETVAAPKPQPAVLVATPSAAAPSLLPPVAAVVPVAAPMPAAARAPATTAEASSTAAVTAAAVAASAAAALRAKVSVASAPAVAPEAPVTAPAVPAAVSSPAPDRVRQLSDILAGTAKPAAASAVAAPTVAAPTAVAAPVGDDLTRIRGIDRDLARLLNDRGVTKFAQIGTWTNADADRFGSALSLKLGRIQQESWIEQSRLLAGMGPMPVAPTPPGDRAEGAGTAAPASWHQRPVQTDWSPAQIAADAAARQAASAPATAGPATAQPTAPVAAAAVAASGGAASGSATSGGARVVRSGVPDDLKRIKGIGVVLEKKLHGLGVINYGQIAGWSQGEIDKMSEVLDFKGRIERENWIEQARILATGGITDFARRVDRGEVETNKPRPIH